MCSGAGWKWSDSKSSYWRNPYDATTSSCQHDCWRQPLTRCSDPASETPCSKEAGWKDKADKTSLHCDPDPDYNGASCQEDCCDKMPDCSADYGTEDAKCNIEPSSSSADCEPAAPPLWISKYNQSSSQAETYCTGDITSCTREECCNGVCDSSLCGTEQVLNSTAAAVRCEGVACNAAACSCVEKPAVDATGVGDASAVQKAASIEVVQMAIIGIAVGFVLLVTYYALSDDTPAPEGARFYY
eukprot:g4478.t1